MSELARPGVGADAQTGLARVPPTSAEKSAHAPVLRWSRNRFVAPAVFLLFLAISVGLLNEVWRAPLTHIDGTQDAIQSIWFMTWPAYALTHHHSPFTSTYMNYPDGINLLWNTSAIGPGLLFWPVTAIWNAVLTYNVIMTASTALAGVFGFIAIRRYVPSALAVLPGAAIYAFSPYMMAHLTGHLHSVASAVTAPLLLLLLDEMFVRQRMRSWLLGILLAALAVFQFFTHEENFVTEIMGAALLALVLAVLFRPQVRQRWPYVARTLAVAAPVGAAVLAYPVYVQLFGPGRVLGTIHDPDVYATDLLNLVVPDYLQQFAPAGAQSLSNHFTGNASEWNAYLGLPLVVIALFTIVRYKKVAIVRVAGLMAGLITLLALGPHLHVAGHTTSIPLPWWIVARIPLVRDVLPARLGVYIYLAVATLLAYALTRLATARVGAVLATGAAALALIPLTPAFPLRSVPVSSPAFFTTSAVNAIPQGAVMLAIPWTSPDALQQMNALMWAAESHMRFRVIGGYFLNAPAAGQEDLHAFVDSLAGTLPIPQLDSAGRSHILGMLRQNDVGVVVLGPVPQQAAGRNLLTGLFGSRPLEVDGNDLWLVPAPAPRP
jgi:hypothetical protein